MVASDAQYAEWKAGDAARQQQFQEDLALRGMAIEEANSRALIARYQADVNQWNAEAIVTPPNHVDVMNTVRIATGQTPDEIAQIWTDYQKVENDLLILANENITTSDLQALTATYGTMMGTGSGSIDIDALEQFVSRRATQLRSAATGAATRFITAGAAKGVVFTPQELGFSDDLYRAAVGPLNVLMNPESAPDSSTVDQFLRIAVANAEGEFIPLTAAAGLWQQAEELGMLPTMRAMGITEPKGLEAALAGQSEAYNAAAAGYNQLEEWHRSLTGEAGDYRTIEGIQSLSDWGTRVISAFQTAQAEAEAFTGAPTWLGGAVGRDAQAALTNLINNSGLSEEALQQLGVVSTDMYGRSYLTDARTLGHRLMYIEPLINDGITSAHALYNW
jgi:hypothetical protein